MHTSMRWRTVFLSAVIVVGTIRHAMTTGIRPIFTVAPLGLIAVVKTACGTVSRQPTPSALALMAG